MKLVLEVGYNSSKYSAAFLTQVVTWYLEMGGSLLGILHIGPTHKDWCILVEPQVLSISLQFVVC